MTSKETIIAPGWSRMRPHRGDRMIRWWLLLAAAGVAVSGCLSGHASLARSSSRPVAAGAGPGIPAAAPGGRGIPALEGKAGSAALPRLIYPSLGINVSARPPAAPGRLAADGLAWCRPGRFQGPAGCVACGLGAAHRTACHHAESHYRAASDGAWSAASRSLSRLGGHLPSRAARIVWAAFILEKLPEHVRGHHGRRDGLLDSLLQSRQL